jgi:SagB-type dehydrogenase family enzyme
MTEGIGDRFQKETKYYRGQMPGGYLDWSSKPQLYKVYPNSTRIELDPPLEPSMSLNEALERRRSIRQFSEKPLTLQQASHLLWACTGIQRKERGYELRTAPSAGALYPIETYAIINRVENLEKGVYHYGIRDHILEVLEIGDFRRKITQAALDQRMCSECAIIFVWTAIFSRSKWKYNQRAYRYIYLDAGHIAENLALAAVSLGLGSCHVGALFDDEVNAIVDVDGNEESAIYLTVVGYPL